MGAGTIALVVGTPPDIGPLCVVYIYIWPSRNGVGYCSKDNATKHLDQLVCKWDKTLCKHGWLSY